MSDLDKKSTITLRVLAFIAIGFGLMTLKAGGFALFGGVAGKEFAGNFVPFVLWFNFSAGFFYIASGVGMFLRKKWSVDLAIVITSLTALVFVAFGLFIFIDGIYEMKTLGAMSFRTITWVVLSILSARTLGGSSIQFLNKE